MSCASRVHGRCLPSRVAALAVVGVLVVGAERLSAASDTGSPGPLAQSCGVPAASGGTGGGRAGGGRGLPVFPPAEYPVKLPPVSPLGAHNDLPNPYRAGMSWGQLPEGRKWGS